MEGLGQGRKKSQYKHVLPCWPLLQAASTQSHWGLQETLMECLSELPMEAVISQPPLVKSGSMSTNYPYSQVAHV